MADVVWTPDEETLERANVVRLMRSHGLENYRELVRRSQEEPDWFWAAVVEDLGIEFSTPWERVCDLSRGPEWATWFVGGTVSIARNCVHRWADRTPEQVAALHGPRLEMMLSKIIDTTVRGVVYEAAGTIAPDAFATGIAELRRTCGKNEIPIALIEADPADGDAWVVAARHAIGGLIGLGYDQTR